MGVAAADADVVEFAVVSQVSRLKVFETGGVDLLGEIWWVVSG